MKAYFALNHNPDAKDLKELAQKTGLTKRVLQVYDIALQRFIKFMHCNTVIIPIIVKSIRYTVSPG